MTTFVALGDSITLGVGDPVRRLTGSRAWRGWAALLAEGLHEPRLHILASLRCADRRRRARPAARGAAAAAGHRQRRRRGQRHAAGRTSTSRQVAAAAAHTVGALRAAGAEVLTMRLPDPGRMLGLPGVAGPAAGPADARGERHAWTRLAERFGTLHYDAAGDAEVHDPRMWAVDRLHPSERGHRLIACRFHDLLAARRACRPGPGPIPSRPARRRPGWPSSGGWPPRAPPGCCAAPPTWCLACWPWRSGSGARARPAPSATMERVAAGPRAPQGR